MNNIKIEFLTSELNKVLEFIRFADTKIAFVFAIYAATFGAWFAKIEDVKKSFGEHWIICAIFVVSFLTGFIFLASAIRPQLKNATKLDKSILFFSHVAKMEFGDFLHKFEDADEDRMKKLLLEQIYTNSVIAAKKMNRIRWAINILFVVLVSTAAYFLICSPCNLEVGIPALEI